MTDRSDRVIKIATRNSRLATFQATVVKEELESRFPNYKFELNYVRSEVGDLNKDKPLADLGLGVFVRSIEQSLLASESDIAVHSLKDVPTILTEGLEIVAFLEREDARDVNVSRDNICLKELPIGAKIGTSSPRRGVQILNMRSDLQIVPIRGNVPTRVSKIETLECDAVVLAAAGLKRLQLDNHISEYLDIDDFVPAPGQGIIGVQIRSDDQELFPIVRALNNVESEVCSKSERKFLELLGSGCQMPVGAHARIIKGELHMISSIGDLNLNKCYVSRVVGQLEKPESLAEETKYDFESREAKYLIERYT